MGIMAGNRGGGMRNNRLMILLVLVGVALALHYCNRSPADKSPRTDTGQPRNSPLPDDVATDTRPDADGERADGNDAALEAYLPISGGGELVRHKAFVLEYAEAYEQARWVLHRVLGKGGKAKRSNKFMPDPEVSTGSALPSDYTRSGYDRGHMAPAGDFKYDQEATNETFYMSNMSPQDHALNIGIWNDLEEQIRRWAKKRGSLVVVTGPVLRPGLPTIGRSARVAVPERYFKIVYDPARREAVAFLIENRNYPDTDLRAVAVSIDAVEKATGLDFFARLPDAVEQAIERQPVVGDWF